MLIEAALLMALTHQRDTVPVYHVKAGDTMSGVAVRECHGHADRWTGIYAASRARGWTARNANYIQVGQRLAVACRYVPSQLPAAGQPLYRPSSRAGSAYVRPSVYRHRSYRSRSYRNETYQGSDSMQRCIIARESGGNSQVMNSSGHYGLYQFSHDTWVAHGGNPSDFGHASAAEQTQVYYNTVAADGYRDWSPYDGC